MSLRWLCILTLCVAVVDTRRINRDTLARALRPEPDAEDKVASPSSAETLSLSSDRAAYFFPRPSEINSVEDEVSSPSSSTNSLSLSRQQAAYFFPSPSVSMRSSVREEIAEEEVANANHTSPTIESIEREAEEAETLAEEKDAAEDAIEEESGQPGDNEASAQAPTVQAESREAENMGEQEEAAASAPEDQEEVVEDSGMESLPADDPHAERLQEMMDRFTILFENAALPAAYDSDGYAKGAYAELDPTSLGSQVSLHHHTRSSSRDSVSSEDKVSSSSFANTLRLLRENAAYSFRPISRSSTVEEEIANANHTLPMIESITREAEKAVKAAKEILSRRINYVAAKEIMWRQRAAAEDKVSSSFSSANTLSVSRERASYFFSSASEGSSVEEEMPKSNHPSLMRWRREAEEVEKAAREKGAAEEIANANHPSPMIEKIRREAEEAEKAAAQQKAAEEDKDAAELAMQAMNDITSYDITPYFEAKMDGKSTLLELQKASKTHKYLGRTYRCCCTRMNECELIVEETDALPFGSRNGFKVAGCGIYLANSHSWNYWLQGKCLIDLRTLTRKEHDVFNTEGRFDAEGSSTRLGTHHLVYDYAERIMQWADG